MLVITLMSFVIGERGIQTPLACYDSAAVEPWSHRNVHRSAHAAWCYTVDVTIILAIIVRKRIGDPAPLLPPCERCC